MASRRGSTLEFESRRVIPLFTPPPPKRRTISICLLELFILLPHETRPCHPRDRDHDRFRAESARLLSSLRDDYSTSDKRERDFS